MHSGFRRLSLAAMLLLSPPLLAEQFTLMSSPQYPPDQASQVFQPLVDYLAAKTGHSIRLQTPRDYQAFWIQLRRGEVSDLMLSDAPVTNLLTQRHQYQLVARVAEDVQFSLLTTGDRADDPTSAFIGYNISTLPSPSLGYLVLADHYDNPLAQPEIKSNARSWLDAIEMVFAMEADAAMAPSWLTERYPNLYPVYSSKSYPGLTLSAAPDVAEEVTQALQQALLVLHEDPKFYAALNELNASQFVVPQADDYRGMMQMLGTMFGYAQND